MGRKGLAILLVFAFLGAAVLAIFPPSPNPENISNTKVKVLATFYPLAYLAEEIGGERVAVKTLIPYNTEVHSWQPSISDMIAVSGADMIILNGGGLDWWMEDILNSVNVSGKIVVNTTKGLELIPLINDGANEMSGAQSRGKYDPHTWLSPYMAARQAEKIFSALTEKDPSGREYYQARFEALKKRLEDLDAKYQKDLLNKTRDIIIVAHEAYGYLAARYGFRQQGVVGISAEQQPSVQVIKDLVDVMTEYNIKVIYLDPAYSDSYVMMLKREVEARTGWEVRVMRLYLALGPVDGRDYMGQIEANLEALKAGLVEP
ncbi:MAG: zinc ABC transporter substrate-binding protein [Candidatus Methanomethyliaceae archaeon]|nr:zinc ABC transporter substrate-binding protein [Candidatus Methanomethyliaceae archaeon]